MLQGGEKETWQCDRSMPTYVMLILPEEIGPWLLLPASPSNKSKKLF